MGRRVVLAGNPNVGKSVIFSHLTGISVIISNYPGTTVDFSRGTLRLADEIVELIDAPGTYSIHSESPAERVAAAVLKTADVIINVIDANNLERNLYLTMELQETSRPMIVVLNMVDEAAHKGIAIDHERLSELLGVPVIPTVALSGRGLRQAVTAIGRAKACEVRERTQDERWTEVGRITGSVQTITHRHRTWLEALQDATLRPATGLPMAAGVMFFAFQFIIRLGQWMEELISEELFLGPYAVAIDWLSLRLGRSGFVHDLLIGKLFDGAVSFEESLGVLTTGVYVEFGVVLPFLVTFYLVLGLLEDTGFMPRLAVLTDRFMHRLGLHGYAIVPLILGFGCNVPAAMSARNLDSRRERFIACTLIAIAVPCMAQLALIVGLVGRHGGQYLAVVFATLFALWIVLGLVIDRVTGGFTPSMILEIPPYRPPQLKALGKKLWMRTTHFAVHATPWILGGIAFVNVLHLTGVIDVLAVAVAPVVSGLFGLPGEAVSSLIIGFLRKDVAVAMLEPLRLDARQLVIGSTLLAIYFPCVATFTVLARELGARDTLAAVGIMVATTLVTGTFLNLVLDRLLPAGLLAAVLVVGSIVVSAAVKGASERREFAGGDPHL